ncbi:MAG: cell wall-binding repeat-containing protein [bacterium]|nr:cell wall-binding repeat-containing protein [bacterium]
MQKLTHIFIVSSLIIGSALVLMPGSAWAANDPGITASADTTAPGAPAEIGAFPTTKTASDQFTIFWDNPSDPSGIEAAWYKLDSAPTGNADGTRLADVTDPSTPTIGLIASLATAGRTTRTLYIWLEDGSGNTDYTTAVSLILRPEGAPEDLLRVAGADRYATAVATSNKIFPVDGSAESVLLANGSSTADALAGVPLGFTANGPILLIKGNQIPAEVYAELQRVLPAGGRVYLLGGAAVINQAQQDFLTAAGYDVKRLAGENRMATSVKVMEELDFLRGTSPDHIYLVNGYAPADALSVAPLAAYLQDGIALTEPGDLSQIIRDYANVNLATITNVTIVGGSAVVPTGVANLFESAGYTVDRVGGANRYDTSRLLADKYIDDVPLAPPGVALASGTSLADALPAGIHAAAQLYPMLLVPKDITANTCERTVDFLQDYSGRIQGGYIYGGEAVVTSASEVMAEQMISGALNFGCPV